MSKPKNIIESDKQFFKVIKKEEFFSQNHVPKGLTFDRSSTGNYRITAKNNDFSLYYYIEPKMLFDPSVMEKIMSAAKAYIRHSESYSAYKKYLFKVIGLTFDVFNSHFTTNNVELHMHHGPIFSMQDYCDIILNYRLDNNMLTNVFSIAKDVMDEHAANHVQVSMLCQNNHILVHRGVLHLRLDQCWGNPVPFIEKYRKQIFGSPRIMDKISRYKEELTSTTFHDTSVIQPGTMIDWSLPQDAYPKLV
jgi:hypothetical protein